MPAFSRGELLASLIWDADWVSAVAFVGPRHLAAGNNLGQILVWSVEGQKVHAEPVALLSGHTNQITKLVAPSSGEHLISSSFDRTLRYWNLDDAPGKERKIVLNERAFDSARRRSGSKKVEPIEVPVRERSSFRTLTFHNEWIQAMDLSQDGFRVISGDDGSRVVVWEQATGKKLSEWTATGWCYAVALSPDHRLAVVTERLPLVFDSGRHAGVRIWNVEKKEVVLDVSKEFKGTHFIAAKFSPDGKLLFLGRGGECDGMNGKISVVEIATGKKLKDWEPGHLNGITDMQYHPAGKHLVTTGRDTLVRFWEIATGKMVLELGKSRGGQFKDWIHAVAFSPDGSLVATADMAGLVHVWKLS
jgi:WD40 repeat protein